MTGPLFHVAEAAVWDEAVRTGDYPWSTRGLRYDAVGFVHLARPEQVEGVIARWFAGAGPLVVLEVDPDALPGEVRFEAAEPGAEAFPHHYGALPVAAVRGLRRVRVDPPE